jgi:hypothetical protein
MDGVGVQIRCAKVKRRRVPYVKRLIASFPPRRSGFASGQACGVCGGQSGIGAGFLRVLRFPLPIIIPSISPSS